MNDWQVRPLGRGASSKRQQQSEAKKRREERFQGGGLLVRPPGSPSALRQHVTKARVKHPRVRGLGAVRGHDPGIGSAFCVTGQIPGLVNAKRFEGGRTF